MFKKLDKSVCQRLTISLVGAPGSGKTYLATRFPRPVIVSCDVGPIGGLSSAPPDVTYTQVTKWEQGLLALSEAQRLIKTENYETLVVDGFANLSRLCIQDVTGRSNKEVPELREWSLIVERLRNFILSACLNTPPPCRFVIFTTADAVILDNTTGQLRIEPNLPGTKLAREIVENFDQVWYLESSFSVLGKQYVRKLHTGGYPAWTKDRQGIFAENPTLESPSLWRILVALGKKLGFEPPEEEVKEPKNF